MFLKTSLAGRDLSCHVTGISNMQKSVHKKTDKTSLVRQVDFSRGFMQRLFLYTSDPCQCIEQHIVTDEISEISKLVTFVTIYLYPVHTHEFLPALICNGNCLPLLHFHTGTIHCKTIFLLHFSSILEIYIQTVMETFFNQYLFNFEDYHLSHLNTVIVTKLSPINTVRY